MNSTISEQRLIDKNEFESNFILYFSVALLAYLVVYGFEITHFSLSIDEEPRNNFAQTLSAGRWGHALLREYLLPEPYVPFFTTVFSVVTLSISGSLSAIFLRLGRSVSVPYLIMLAALPQLSYQLEFSNQADTVAISMFFSVASLFMLRNISILKSIFFVILTVCSLSVYQSIFLYSASIICVWMAIRCTKKEINFISSLKIIILFILLTALSLIINSFLAKNVAGYFGVMQSDYLSSMIGWGKRGNGEVLSSLWRFIRDYLTFKAAYGLNAFPFCIIWLVGSIVLAFKNKYNVVLTLFYCLAALLSAFLLNIAIGSSMPPRAMTQIPVVFAGLFAIFLTMLQKKHIGLIISVLFLINGSAASNSLFYSDYMARVSDRAFSERLIARIYSEIPSFNVEDNPVFFYGSYSPKNNWKIPTADVFGSSFFEWDGGNNRRMYQYLETANIIQFKIPNPAQVSKAIDDAKDMPEWPAANSVQLKDGVVIVKLSNKLSPYNR